MRYSVLGLMCYNKDYSGVDRTEKLDVDFRSLKGHIKKHFNSHTHKAHVLEIENSERVYQIQRDGARDGRAAAMRCARLCFLLFKKGRPFSDYPDLVATIVAEKTFMGETNHSIQFPRHFVQSVAQVVKNKVKAYLKTPLKQTGYKPPVKIVADKDTLKHRTRQIIALTSFFPDADKLIQTLYISHPLVRHHSGKKGG